MSNVSYTPRSPFWPVGEVGIIHRGPDGLVGVGGSVGLVNSPISAPAVFGDSGGRFGLFTGEGELVRFVRTRGPVRCIRFTHGSVAVGSGNYDGGSEFFGQLLVIGPDGQPWDVFVQGPEVVQVE